MSAVRLTVAISVTALVTLPETAVVHQTNLCAIIVASLDILRASALRVVAKAKLATTVVNKDTLGNLFL